MHLCLEYVRVIHFQATHQKNFNYQGCIILPLILGHHNRFAFGPSDWNVIQVARLP